MSSTSADAELIHSFAGSLTDSYVSTMAVVVLAYDYVITLDQEINLFWRRKLSGATALFLSIRYLALLAYVFLGLVTYTSLSDELTCFVLGSCARVERTQYYVQVAQFFVWAAFSGMRTLALTGRNWPLSALAFVLACGPFAVNLWVAINGVTGTNIPLHGCSGGNTQTARQAVIGVTVSRFCSIAADCIVISVTWSYAAKGTGLRTISQAGIPSLAKAMVVNGKSESLNRHRALITFGVIHVTLTLLSIVQAEAETSTVTTLTDPVTAVLIWRFLLALQSANQKSMHGESYDATLNGDGDSLHFASGIIGSMGGSLAVGESQADFYDEYGTDASTDGDTYVGSQGLSNRTDLSLVH
ncbi:hypothetical protein OH77DRAFT_1429808 [Trametes cingulata]|nr:hypothetical protein OH77DRAFT_1429808 [Trametes cingulata]